MNMQRTNTAYSRIVLCNVQLTMCSALAMFDDLVHIITHHESMEHHLGMVMEFGDVDDDTCRVTSMSCQ